MRDTHERTPPILKAALASSLLGVSPPQLAALAVTLILCVGGATTDAWLTLPPNVAGVGAKPTAPPLARTLALLAREARAAERALAGARFLVDRDHDRVRAAFGRAAYSALDVLQLLRERIVITIPLAAEALSLTPPTAGAAVARLEGLGIAREVTGRARSRVYAYEELVRTFEPARQS
jgi:hypothetical protein